MRCAPTWQTTTCCSFSTTASTSWTNAPSSRPLCSRSAAACGSWPRAGSRSASVGRPSGGWSRSGRRMPSSAVRRAGQAAQARLPARRGGGGDDRPAVRPARQSPVRDRACRRTRRRHVAGRDPRGSGRPARRAPEAGGSPRRSTGRFEPRSNGATSSSIRVSSGLSGAWPCSSAGSTPPRRRRSRRSSPWTCSAASWTNRLSRSPRTPGETYEVPAARDRPRACVRAARGGRRARRGARAPPSPFRGACRRRPPGVAVDRQAAVRQRAGRRLRERPCRARVGGRRRTRARPCGCSSEPVTFSFGLDRTRGFAWPSFCSNDVRLETGTAPRRRSRPGSSPSRWGRPGRREGLLAQALELSRELEEPVLEAWALFFQGLVETLAGENEAGRRHLEASRAIHHRARRQDRRSTLDRGARHDIREREQGRPRAGAHRRGPVHLGGRGRQLGTGPVPCPARDDRRGGRGRLFERRPALPEGRRLPAPVARCDAAARGTDRTGPGARATRPGPGAQGRRCRRCDPVSGRR